MHMTIYDCCTRMWQDRPTCLVILLKLNDWRQQTKGQVFIE